jgi:hypothetical protein
MTWNPIRLKFVIPYKGYIAFATAKPAGGYRAEISLANQSGWFIVFRVPTENLDGERPNGGGNA